MGKKKKGKKGKRGGGYDATADMFDGVENAPMPGSGVYFSDGVYLTRIEAFKRGTSTKPGGGTYTVTEFTILDVLVPYEGSNKAGERVAWIVKSEWGESAHSARKGFVAAALECRPEEVTAKVLKDLTNPKSDKSIVGLQLVTTAVSVPTKRGGIFTKCTHTPPGDYDEPKKKKKGKKGKKSLLDRALAGDPRKLLAQADKRIEVRKRKKKWPAEKANFRVLLDEAMEGETAKILKTLSELGL